MTTFNDAKRCPKCDMPGDDVSSQPAKRRGTVVHVIFCRNDGCNWYNTSWLVQVNEDGTIPEPYSQIGPKQYPKLSAETETRVQEAIQKQLQAETQPGAEVRNPHG
jgi:hypothetical protein